MKNTLLYYFDYFTSWLDFSWFITLPKRKDAINYLPPCYKEQEDKVKEQYWPKHGQVKYLEKCRKKTHNNRSHSPVPELEFGQFTSKWSKLVRP